jgi:hypothetical protein
MQFIFGTGSLFGTALTDANGNSIANPFPREVRRAAGRVARHEPRHQAALRPEHDARRDRRREDEVRLQGEVRAPERPHLQRPVLRPDAQRPARCRASTTTPPAPRSRPRRSRSRPRSRARAPGRGISASSTPTACPCSAWPAGPPLASTAWPPASTPSPQPTSRRWCSSATPTPRPLRLAQAGVVHQPAHGLRADVRRRPGHPVQRQAGEPALQPVREQQARVRPKQDDFTTPTWTSRRSPMRPATSATSSSRSKHA